MANRKKTAGVQCSLVWKVTSIVLALTLVAGAVLATLEFGTPYKPSNGFRPTVQTPVTPDEGNVELPPLDENGDELLTDGTAQAMPQRMVFRSTARSMSETTESMAASLPGVTTVTLTATIEPADADNKLVDWSVKYEDGTTGDVATKVLVNPTSNGSLTANVTNYGAFSKKIVITVTSRDNPSVSATCTCDYLAQLTGVNVSLTNGGSVSKIVVGDNKTYTANATPIFSAGTIQPTVTTSYSSSLGKDGESTDKTTNFTYAITMGGCPYSFSNKNIFETKNTFVSTSELPKELATVESLPPLDTTVFYMNAFKKAVTTCTGGNHFYVSATVTARYNGSEMITVTAEKGYKFDVSNIKTSVTGISVNGSLLFPS